MKENSLYRNIVKRILDFCICIIAVIILSPLFLVLIILGAIFMQGNPFFVQPRPGKNEEIFDLIKFRTMSNAKDRFGNLLSDEERLNKYGVFLRTTSLDELPELFNIIKGDMALVGPRPQLVRDMVFMSKEQRKRHTVRQGLTGLAQVSGRNLITWEEKLQFDLDYIENISFKMDLKIVGMTIVKAIKREGINAEGEATALDFGDYLLSKKKITQLEYDEKNKISNQLINEHSLRYERKNKY